MIRHFKWSMIAIVAVVLCGCSTTAIAYNRMLPEGGDYNDDEMATIVVAYPLKPNAIDRSEIPEVGGEDTIIVVLPGEHQLVTHMDTATNPMDYMVVPTSTEYVGGYMTVTHYGTAGDVQTSGAEVTPIMTYPGHIHFFRIVMQADEGFWTGLTHGPNPFHAPDNVTLAFNPEEATVLVTAPAGETKYSLYTKLIYFSPDGAHVAFITNEKGKWHVVIDGVQGTVFDGLHTASRAWSLDGSLFAYAAYFKVSTFKEELYIVVNNDTRIGPLDGIDPGSPMFFDQNNNLVCTILRDDVWYVKRGDLEDPALSKSEARLIVWSELKRLYER